MTSSTRAIAFTTHRLHGLDDTHWRGHPAGPSSPPAIRPATHRGPVNPPQATRTTLVVVEALVALMAGTVAALTSRTARRLFS